MDIIGGSYILITPGSLRVNVDLMLLSNISNMRGRNNECMHYQAFQEFKSTHPASGRRLLYSDGGIVSSKLDRIASQWGIVSLPWYVKITSKASQFPS